MGQVTIYLDDETEQRMVASARLMNLSKSRWIARAIQDKLIDEWPDGVRELPGSWDDFPEPEDLRRTQGTDSTREPL